MEAATEGITLYWNLMSQPSRAVKALLIAGNIPHKEVTLDLLKQETKGEDYTQINPKQVIPFIKEGDFGLGESNAILKYLCNT